MCGGGGEFDSKDCLHKSKIELKIDYKILKQKMDFTTRNCFSHIFLQFCFFDNYGTQSIGCLAIDPQNTHVIWVGTGENNNQRSVGYGNGIYKSTDGGKSFTNMGLKQSEHIGMIKINPAFRKLSFLSKG